MNIHIINSKNLLNQCIRFTGAILIFVLIMPAVAFSQLSNYPNPSVVPLLTAGTYGALASTGITGSANVSGDVGTITGGIGVGITYTGTNWNIDDVNHNTQAQADLADALTNINDHSARPSNFTIPSDLLNGLTLYKGVYDGVALALTGTLILSGGATDVFIIRASTSLTMNSNSNVLLTGGAVWSNVFWYVGTSATALSGTTFYGIILANTSITLNAGATSVTAQLLANTGAVTINSDVLPVELTSFTAVLNNRVVELNWNTATEVNNYGFNVELRIQNGEWNKIGFIQGHGNSNSPKDYSFVDKNPQVGKLQYRLKQIDFDGAFEYSDVAEVEVESPKQFTVYQNYPNPFNPTTNITYEIPVNSKVMIKVYDVLGSEVAILLNEEKLPGRYQVEFNASHLPSGIYFYSINTGNNNPIMKKMILLK
ncbi:MAG: ice-binding family protein [Ignavibacteriales bacterium]|nr:ice-binding family protein [Ignavibacteriales bacterium]